MKKIVALFISSIFAFNLAIAYADDEKVLNPWERDMLTTTKKEGKVKNQEKRVDKKKDKKTDMVKTRKTHSGKVENASMATTDNKETAQKKKFLFW